MTQSQDSDAHIGRVITVYSGCCDVLLGEEIRLCNLRDTIAKTQKTTLAVGDKVRVINLDDARPLVDEVLPRTTSLSRPDPLKPEIERVLVANVDCVVIVVAARKPAPRPGIIDRIWVAAQRGGAQTRIIVNKMDLTKDRHRAVIEELMSEYEALEVPVHYVSTVTGEGIPELKGALANQVSSLVGHSGVGKSSLINALLEGELARTSEVRQSTGKGRHTTSASTWYIVDENTAIIDTPGVRAFGLMDVGPDALRFYFPDIHAFAEHCHFNDCQHQEEPGCAVLEAFDNGDISPLRYAAWLRLLDSEEDMRIPRGSKAR